MLRDGKVKGKRDGRIGIDKRTGDLGEGRSEELRGE